LAYKQNAINHGEKRVIVHGKNKLKTL